MPTTRSLKIDIQLPINGKQLMYNISAFISGLKMHELSHIQQVFHVRPYNVLSLIISHSRVFGFAVVDCDMTTLLPRLFVVLQSTARLRRGCPHRDDSPTSRLRRRGSVHGTTHQLLPSEPHHGTIQPAYHHALRKLPQADVVTGWEARDVGV